MSIRKRGEIWWIDIRSPNGERVRRSAETTNRQAAQELHDRLKAELWRVSKLGEKPQYTFEEAAVRFLKAHSAQRDFDSKRRYIAYFLQFFSGKSVASIRAKDVLDALPTDRAKPGKQLQALKPSTRNRYLSTMRKLLNDCEKWEWVERAPKLPAEREPRKRIRWITQPEALRLLSTIHTDWFRDVVGFALATGMRAGEIFALQWSQVDLIRRMAWLHPDQCKNGEGRGVPLNDDAVLIVRRQIGLHNERIFSRRGKPIQKEDHNQFKRACRAAGIENFRFHDLRHTWASWHVQAGTPIYVLKELGGWKTIEMVQKYAHLAPQHLSPHANAVTFWSQCNAMTESEKKKAG